MCSDVPNALSFADAIPLCLVGNAACPCGGEAADTHRRRACHPRRSGRRPASRPSLCRCGRPFARSLGQIRSLPQLERRSPRAALGSALRGPRPLPQGWRPGASRPICSRSQGEWHELKITARCAPGERWGKVPSPFTSRAPLETDLSIRRVYQGRPRGVGPAPRHCTGVTICGGSTVSPGFQLYCEARQHLPIASGGLRPRYRGAAPGRFTWPQPAIVDPEFALAMLPRRGGRPRPCSSGSRPA